MVGGACYKVSLQIYLCSLAGFPGTVCILVLGENPENRVGAEISDAFALWSLTREIPLPQRSLHTFSRLKES